MAKLEGDGWLSWRGMVAKLVGEWLAKLEGYGWLGCYGDGWLSW